MADESLQPQYTSADLKHLSDRDHVRERFSMYIGDNTARGLHHLVYEVVDNSIDECMAGHAKHVSVTVNVDGSVTVEDDGRGIPTDRHAQLSEEMDRDVSTLEGVMTVLKFGGKFEKGAYQTSGGLHGVGVTVVNFLSEWCEVEVSRDGHVWQQEYQRGEPTGPVRKMGTSARTGTKTTFKPDPQIFPQTKFSWDVLARRVQELAFLNSGVRITFLDAVSGQKEDFCYERGVVEFVEWLNRSSDSVHADPISIRGEAEGVSWDIAMQYTTEYTENLHSYVNNITTTEGGTHVSGFRSALTRTLNAYGKKSGIYKDLVPTGEDVREGLTTVISVRVPEPQFEGQTKTKLGNGEVEGIINSAVGDFLSKYLEENPKSARAKGRAGGRGQGGCPEGEGPASRAEGGPFRRWPARQAPRLHQPRRGEVRTVPGRGRFGRRLGGGWPAARVSGDPSPARQDHQRLQEPRRQGARQRGGAEHDLGDRRRHRRGSRSGQAAV